MSVTTVLEAEFSSHTMEVSMRRLSCGMERISILLLLRHTILGTKNSKSITRSYIGV
jgi:hypothetical protein